MAQKIICCFFILILPAIGLASSNESKIDSLLKELKTAEDTTRVKLLYKLTGLYRKNDIKSSLRYGHEATTLAEKIGYKRGYAAASGGLGITYDIIGDHKKALELYEACRAVFTELGDSSKIAHTYINEGISYLYLGEYNNGLKSFITSNQMLQRLYKKAPSKEIENAMSNALSNMGSIYFRLNETTKSIEYFRKALEMVEKTGNEDAIGNITNNIGNIYQQNGDLDTAIAYYNKALEIDKKLKDYMGMARVLNNIAIIRRKQNQFDEAHRIYQNILKLNDKHGLHNKDVTYFNMASLFFIKEDFNKVLDYLDSSLAISKEHDDKYQMKSTYLLLSEVYEKTGDPESALKHYKLYTAYKDSVYNEKKSEQIAKMEAQYQNKQHKKDIELLTKEKQLQETELEKNNLIIYAFSGGFALMILLVFFILKNYREKQRSNKMLSEQNQEIRSQKEVIEEKNISITDSIRYAQRIQNTLLPPPETFSEHLPESFIFYRPKDIVSGDFYWIHKIGEDLYFAAVDCTGHGVPGAFVSIMGHNALNQAVNEFRLTAPAAILDKVNDLINEGFSSYAGANPKTGSISDGMDMALCKLTQGKDRWALEYAGANNPLWIITDERELFTADNQKLSSTEHNNLSLYELKADKQPIGKFRDRKPFTNHALKLKKGDTLYIFSDGFADQFGGQKGKKFKNKPFKDLLLSMQGKTMAEQKNEISNSFDSWKEGFEQIDDVCIIGVRL